MADDPSSVDWPLGSAGCDEGVEAPAIRIANKPRVAPSLLAPSRGIEFLVPASVRDHDRVGEVLCPDDQVRRSREPDLLYQASVDGGDPGVKHVPGTVVLDDRPGPRSQVVPRLRRTWAYCVLEDPPGDQVFGDRMANAGVLVPKGVMAKSFRSLQVEDVECGSGLGQLEIPHLPILKPQHARGYAQPVVASACRG